MKKFCFLWLFCLGLGLFAQNPGSVLPENDGDREKIYINPANKASYIYYDAGKFDSALYYARLGLKIAESKDRIADAYMARFNIIAALIRLKRLKEAEKELVHLRKEDIPQQELRLSTHYYVAFGNYQLAENNRNKAMAYYDSAIQLAHNMQQPELWLFVYKNIAESFAAVRDTATAYRYAQYYNKLITDIAFANNQRRPGKKDGPLNREGLEADIKYFSNENEIKKLQLQKDSVLQVNLQKENTLKDSILQKEKLLSAALTRADSLHNMQLRDEKNLSAALKRETALQSAQLNSEKKLRIGLASGLIIGLCLAVVIFLQYSRQRKKSIIIKNQSLELQTLLKEIHHRVKNNMQIVSSLLDLQSYTIKDQGASEAVKESRNRVQSMALIHQNLYGEGNIKTVVMKDYIQNLALNLFDSYNIQKDKIKLETDIDHLNLDVDTVIPIGLVLNELISNSLKYAFKGRESGLLSVVLKEKNHELILHVQDNGNGFPEGWNSKLNQSFGYKLIKAFAQKLKAKLDVHNDNGACVLMHITKYKIV